MFYATCYRNFTLVYDDGFTDYDDEVLVHVCSTSDRAEALLSAWKKENELHGEYSSFGVLEVDETPGSFALCYLNHKTDLNCDLDVQAQLDALLPPVTPRLERGTPVNVW